MNIKIIHQVLLRRPSSSKNLDLLHRKATNPLVLLPILQAFVEVNRSYHLSNTHKLPTCINLERYRYILKSRTKEGINGHFFISRQSYREEKEDGAPFRLLLRLLVSCFKLLVSILCACPHIILDTLKIRTYHL